MEFTYDLTVDPHAENNTHAFALRMIGHNKTVLEVGCAKGYFTEALVNQGCKVVGIEIDPEAASLAEQWADHVIVGNVDETHTWDQVDDELFDVVTFGDVLEHLVDPLAALRRSTAKLKPTGFIVTSIPNVAHGDLRLSLLRGSFEYRDTGLLDRTHLHFFTLDSIRELLYDAGLVIVDTRRVIVPMFASEFGLRSDDFPDAVLEEVRADSEFETYQFVMKSVLDTGSQAVLGLADRVGELTDLVSELEVRNRAMENRVVGHEALKESAQRYADHIEDLTRQVHELHAHIGEVTALAEARAAAAEEAAELAAAVRELELALEDSRRENLAILNSKAFRLTAPLRRLRAAFPARGPL